MSFSLEGKVALVTGANRGIGKAIVESFIQHGASKVYLAVRNPESTQSLAQSYGDKVVTLPFDATDPASITALTAAANDVDVVVNNAGILETAQPLDEHAIASLEKEMTVNVYGLIRMAQAFTPVLAQKSSAAFVQLNSVASMKNFTPFTTYSASKAASYSVTQGLKDALEPQGIQVLSVHPGPIKTDMLVQAGFDDGDSVTSVSEGIVAALKAGDFHLFPDEMAKFFEGEYSTYAANVVLADFSEG